jgi:hypothetical protein
MKRVVGGTLPATIWKRFMAEATKMIAEDPLRVATQPFSIPALSADVMAKASEEDLNQPPEAGGACDVATCSQAYRSFRASDCTYQPYDGPRRLCTRGSPGDQVNRTATADVAPARRRGPERVFRVPRVFFHMFNVR